MSVGKQRGYVISLGYLLQASEGPCAPEMHIDEEPIETQGIP